MSKDRVDEKKNDVESIERGKDDAALRIGARHGEDTLEDEHHGYARDIAPEGVATDRGDHSKITSTGVAYTSKQHPSRRLELRSRGFGIGGGYERPYRKDKAKRSDAQEELYGPLPHSGYYGTGEAARPFKAGQATFQNELSWYKNQYGESTSGFEKSKK